MDNCQEITVIHFLLGLCKQLDSIDESRYDYDCSNLRELSTCQPFVSVLSLLWC